MISGGCRSSKSASERESRSRKKWPSLAWTTTYSIATCRGRRSSSVIVPSKQIGVRAAMLLDHLMCGGKRPRRPDSVETNWRRGPPVDRRSSRSMIRMWSRLSVSFGTTAVGVSGFPTCYGSCRSAAVCSNGASRRPWDTRSARKSAVLGCSMRPNCWYPPTFPSHSSRRERGIPTTVTWLPHFEPT